jgi:hypothetical protein
VDSLKKIFQLFTTDNYGRMFTAIIVFNNCLSIVE